MIDEYCYIQFVGPDCEEVITVKRWNRTEPDDVCYYLAEFRDLIQALGALGSAGRTVAQYCFWDISWELASYGDDEAHGAFENRYVDILHPEIWEDYPDLPDYWRSHEVVANTDFAEDAVPVYQVHLPDDGEVDWGLAIGSTSPEEDDSIKFHWEGTIEDAISKMEEQ